MTVYNTAKINQEIQDLEQRLVTLKARRAELHQLCSHDWDEPRLATGMAQTWVRDCRACGAEVQTTNFTTVMVPDFEPRPPRYTHPAFENVDCGGQRCGAADCNTCGPLRHGC